MHKLSKDQRIIISAILISLLIHFMVLFFLFTHKSPQQSIDLFKKKNADLKIIKVIKEDPPVIVQATSPATMQQPSITNPVSSKEAEVLEGNSIISNDTVTGGQVTAITPDSQDESFHNETESEPTSVDQSAESFEEMSSRPAEAISDKHEKEMEKEKSDSDTTKLLTRKKPLVATTLSRQQREDTQKSLSQFARAFSREYDKVQRKQPSPQISKGGSVYRQQTELQTMSYRQKIDQAIYSAAFRNGNLYSDANIDQQIQATITIDRDGKIINFIMEDKTISSKVNDYIKRVVYSANFPPLPKHLNIDSWSYTWRPYVRIKKGMNNLRYEYH